MRTHDTLQRRFRQTRLPTGRRVLYPERDIVWLEKLHRHGPLATSYLLEYTTRRDHHEARKRLKHFFHEDATPHGGPYLDRPWQQFQTLDPETHELVYANTKHADLLLTEHKLLRTNTPTTSPISWKHDVMCSFITASIELAVLKQPEKYEYIFHDEIVERLGTFSFPVPVGGLVKNLRPDRAFGIKYKEVGGALIFLVEADCSTEPNNPESFDRKSHKRSILQYEEFLGRGLYKQYFWQGARVMLLSVFASEAKMRNVRTLTSELTKGNSFTLFAAWPAFARYFVPPKPRHDLFTAPWTRAGYEPFNISKP